MQPRHSMSVIVLWECRVSTQLSHRRAPVVTLREQGSHFSLCFIKRGPPGPSIHTDARLSTQQRRAIARLVRIWGS